jgi:hypothetical protein
MFLPKKTIWAQPKGMWGGFSSVFLPPSIVLLGCFFAFLDVSQQGDKKITEMFP